LDFLGFESLVPEDLTASLEAWRCKREVKIGGTEDDPEYCRDLAMCSHCRCDHFVRKKIETKTSGHKYFRSCELDFTENKGD
jgi:hypothetical protein